MVLTLDEAISRIYELEKENSELKAELEVYRNRNYGGRKKHNEAWQRSYNDFVVKLEQGMSVMEIENQGDISRRTAYRYKAFYEKQRGNLDG